MNGIKSFKLFVWLTFLTGIVYPVIVTLLAQFFMYDQANGSIIYKNEKAIGSRLIAQKFESNKYFWPRPSAVDYGIPSGGSNLGPTSKKLKETIENRKILYSKAHQGNVYDIPSDLLFASGSGLDPHISIDSAYYQIARVAKSRNLDNQHDKLKKLIDHLAINPRFGFIGKSYVNVLTLNLALDEEFGK